MTFLRFFSVVFFDRDKTSWTDMWVIFVTKQPDPYNRPLKNIRAEIVRFTYFE